MTSRLKPKVKGPIDFPTLSTYKGPELSNTIDGLCPRKDKLFESRWKRGAAEKPETVKAMQEKAKRIRPKYSKGNYAYATDGDNEGELSIYRK